MTSVEEYLELRSEFMSWSKLSDGHWGYTGEEHTSVFDSCYEVLFGKRSYRWPDCRCYPFQIRKVDQHLADGYNARRGVYLLGLMGQNLSREEVEFVTCIGGITRVSETILKLNKERVKCCQKKESVFPSSVMVVLRVLQERLDYLSLRLKICLEGLSPRKKQALSTRHAGISCLGVPYTSGTLPQVTSTCLPPPRERKRCRRKVRTIYFY